MPYKNTPKKNTSPKNQMPSHVGLFQKLRNRRNKTNEAIRSFRQGYSSR